MNADRGAAPDRRAASRCRPPARVPGIHRDEHSREQARLLDDRVDRRVIEEAAAEAQLVGRRLRLTRTRDSRSKSAICCCRQAAIAAWPGSPTRSARRARRRVRANGTRIDTIAVVVNSARGAIRDAASCGPAPRTADPRRGAEPKRRAHSEYRSAKPVLPWPLDPRNSRSFAVPDADAGLLVIADQNRGGGERRRQIAVHACASW